MRFAGVGLVSSSPLRATGNQACGFAAATRVNGSMSAPIARRCSSSDCPRRARSAFSKSG